MWFQSTPAIADGRTRGETTDNYGNACFIPRPPSLTGDPTPAPTVNLLRLEVSIHARHR